MSSVYEMKHLVQARSSAYARYTTKPITSTARMRWARSAATEASKERRRLPTSMTPAVPFLSAVGMRTSLYSVASRSVLPSCILSSALLVLKTFSSSSLFAPLYELPIMCSLELSLK